jgi:glycosyltransferase involved in cell wall biosynthesis
VAVLNNGKTTPEGRSLFEGAWAQLTLLKQVASGVLRHRAQIVHIHSSQFFGFWRDCVHLLLARMLGCRTVFHNHGASFDAWAAGMGPLRLGLLRWAFETASFVVVLSPEWHRKLRRYAPRANWRVIPNGLPMPARVNDVTAAAEPAFLFLGDWTPRKGVRDLVAATETATKQGFRGSVRLAGFEKASGQLAALREHIHEAGCEAIIQVLGTLSIVEKDQALASADCLVLPSYAEGLPMAILEAMSYGIPVIATRVGAIPEVITDGREGFLIEPGDVSALADRMLKISGDPELRRQMGQAARRRVEAEYSLDAMVDRIMNVYAEVLGREWRES